MNKEYIADMEYKIKVLLAWKELAEESDNKWAMSIATKHILAIQRKFYGV